MASNQLRKNGYLILLQCVPQNESKFHVLFHKIPKQIISIQQAPTLLAVIGMQAE